MLTSFFSFNGKLGRLRFLLRVLALGALLVALFLLMFTSSTWASRLNVGAFGPLAWWFLLAFMATIWIGLASQARRFRDIGWNPLAVMVGWMAVEFTDRLVASAVPALSLGPIIRQTPFGVLLNVAMAGALLFWPGKGGNNTHPTSITKRAPEIAANAGSAPPLDISEPRMSSRREFQWLGDRSFGRRLDAATRRSKKLLDTRIVYFDNIDAGGLNIEIDDSSV